jgi:hypothetical protein
MPMSSMFDGRRPTEEMKAVQQFFDMTRWLIICQSTEMEVQLTSSIYCRISCFRVSKNCFSQDAMGMFGDFDEAKKVIIMSHCFPANTVQCAVYQRDSVRLYHYY